MNYLELQTKSQDLNFSNLTSIENLFQAWNEFKIGKKKKNDVQFFERNLEENLFSLHEALKNKTYQHGDYTDFYVQDPKRRHIHKAPVQDRVVHHLLYKYLYELFDKTFIYDSYSCRVDKGTHKGIKRLESFGRIVSKNYTRPCWALKMDIKKFFANVDHGILLQLLRKKIVDEDILWLLKEVIDSFCSCHPELARPERGRRVSGSDSGQARMTVQSCKGIPLGNLTSQVFANIYMDQLDQFVKHQLRVKYYLRYADDFVFLSNNKRELENYINRLKQFLFNSLKLELHPNKIIFRRLDWGIDFLGYIVLPHYILPRTKTKTRVFKKLKMKIHSENFNQSLQSYLGYLSHANSYKLSQRLKNEIWFWRNE